MDDRTATAYHEAGHAVLMWLVAGGIKCVSIVPDGHGRGHCCPDVDRELAALGSGRDLRELRDGGAMCGLAGLCAKRIATGSWDKGGTAEYRLVFRDRLQAPWNNRDRKRTREDLRELCDRTGRVLRGCWAAVEAVKDALLEHDRLDGAQFEDALRQTPIRMIDLPHA